MMLHFANILILCSFMVRDILLLRLLSILAGVFFSYYFLTLPEPMYDPVYWNVLFALVNTIQILLHWFAGRKVPLTPDEVYIKENFFPSLRPLEIRDLFKKSSKESFAQGKELAVDAKALRILLDGTVTVNNTRLREGDFIGVKAYLNDDERDDSDAVAISDVTCLCWPKASLQLWSQGSSDRHTMLLSALSKDLIKKMNRQMIHPAQVAHQE